MTNLPEKIPSIDSLGRILKKRPLNRANADEEGNRSPIICATIPIMGYQNSIGTEIVQLRRSNRVRFLPGTWIWFLSEHRRVSDHNYFETLKRGFQEELGHTINDPSEVYEHHKGQGQNMTFTNKKYGELEWHARIFVVPIIGIDYLSPNPQEVSNVRPINFNTLDENIRKDEHTLRFKPISFLYELLGATKAVLNREIQDLKYPTK